MYIFKTGIFMKIQQIYYLCNSIYINRENVAKKNSVFSFQARFSNGMKKPRHIKENLAYRDFALYNPRMKAFETYTIPIHNNAFTERLQEKYSAKKFEELFNFAKAKGVFDYVYDEKTGFVKTSFINTKENPLMSDLIWITDTCNNMELVKAQNPKDCTTVFNKLTDFYEGQKIAFDKIIENPSLYKNSGFWPQETNGIGHCFEHYGNPHKWFAKTRLESIGNYLRVFSDLTLTGFGGGTYGYKSSADIPDKVIDAVSNCVKYLHAIHYPTARSCGAWEEQTFVNSLTSDTAIINNGLRQILKIVYSNTDDKNLLDLRKRLKAAKYGNIFDNPNILLSLLKDGKMRIKAQPFEETKKGSFNKKVKFCEEKCLERIDDAALSFVPQTEKIDEENIYMDSLIKLIGLKNLAKQIVRPNGAIRYKNDEYLNLDYHTLKNTFTANKKKNEAQWFLVSEISDGYGAIVGQLLDNIEHKGSITDKDIKLIKAALRGQTEFINRSYARITPKRMTKSNMYSCPAYKVPEAYEAVTCKNGKIKYVPGAHPLTWAAASLYKASNRFLENLKRIEGMELFCLN